MLSSLSYTVLGYLFLISIILLLHPERITWMMNIYLTTQIITHLKYKKYANEVQNYTS